jgi:hypothetical protein
MDAPAVAPLPRVAPSAPGCVRRRQPRPQQRPEPRSVGCGLGGQPWRGIRRRGHAAAQPGRWGSRLAYSEILADEKKETAVGFWTRAHVFFTQAWITVERVLIDNGSCYRSHDWRDLLDTAGIAQKPNDARRCPTGCTPTITTAVLSGWISCGGLLHRSGCRSRSATFVMGCRSCGVSS